MIVMVMATVARLSAGLFHPDVDITSEIMWSDKASCDAVLEAHLSKHPAPDNAGLNCIRVPDHVSNHYLVADHLNLESALRERDN